MSLREHQSFIHQIKNESEILVSVMNKGNIKMSLVLLDEQIIKIENWQKDNPKLAKNFNKALKKAYKGKEALRKILESRSGDKNQ